MRSRCWLVMGDEGRKSVGRGEQGEPWKAVGSGPGDTPRRHHALVSFPGSRNGTSIRAAGAPTGAHDLALAHPSQL